MQKGRVLNIGKLKFTSFFIENKLLIIGLFVFIIGVIFGIFVFDKYNVLFDFIKEYLNEYITLRLNEKFFKIFLNSFFKSIVILLLFSVLGTSMYGVVTVPISVCFLGIFYGSVTSFLYSEYALKGIAFNAVIFLPSSIVFIIVMLLACKEAVNFSAKISSITFTKSISYNLSLEFKKFLITYVIFVVAALFSSLIDALISFGFIKYFKF